jgi:leucyl-tRNA synthetase
VTEPDSDAGDTPQHRYTAELAGDIERAWQQTWAESGTFNVPNPVGSLAPQDGSTVPADKMFVQDMFPYPSGDGLHVGPPLGYIATDVYAPYYQLAGRNVLHALGFDAFGLPAEQYAIQTGRIRASAPRPTSSTSAASSGWASGMMPVAASPPPTSTTTSGRSGSSCRSTTRGSTRP